MAPRSVTGSYARPSASASVLPPLDRVRRRSELDLWRPVQRLGRQSIASADRRLALYLQRAVIDALERPVLPLRPDPAHGLDLGAAGAGGVVHASAGQDMGMMVALVVLPVRRMDRHVHGDAVAPDQFASEVADDRRLLGRVDLRRQRQLPLARSDRVHPRLSHLGRVSQRGAILRPGQRTLRRHDERLFDAGLARVVVHAAFALSRDARALAPIGFRLAFVCPALRKRDQASHDVQRP